MMQTPDSIKLTFRLSEEEQGPYPVATESLWCQPQGDGHYRVENIPFFLEGISYGDRITIEELRDEPGTYRIIGIAQESDHSTVWVQLKDSDRGKAVLDELTLMGCTREGGVFPNFFAISVPPTVALDQVVNRLDAAAKSGLLIADYPSVRQTYR